MYINSLHIEKYKIFENLKIKFEIPKNNKNIINVIAGVNGTGKTTLLELLYRGSKISAFEDNEAFDITFNENIVCSEEIVVLSKEELINGKDESFNVRESLVDIVERGESEESSRLIFMPISSVFNYEPQREIIYPLGRYKDIVYKVDISKTLGNAELYIRDYIISQERISIESDPKKRTSDAINKFNMIFKNCNMSTKLIDLDRRGRPLFLTLSGDKVTIEMLSSGEQQLYARVISLMILEPKNSVILIDEPEITLHPKLQQEIINIYKNIGENNQFIITTHSPHVLGAVENKCIRLLVVGDNRKIEVINDVTAYGRDIEWVLEEIMEVGYTREKSILDKFEEIQKIINLNKLDKAEEQLDKLESIIGQNDNDIVKLRNEIAFERIEFEEDS